MGKKKKKHTPPTKSSRQNGGKPSNSKKWKDDYSSLELALGQYGLIIKPIAKDGNCLFRSMADQMLGQDGEAHLELREEVVEHLRANKDKYEGFIDDEQTFESYCTT